MARVGALDVIVVLHCFCMVESTISLRAARMACRKSSCVCFQDLEDFSSGDRRFFSCLGKNSASSVPWILCLAESNGFLFLFADRSQILACFSND